MPDTRPDVDIHRLDSDIEIAWLDVLACRKAWVHSPNHDTIDAEQQAVAALNQLLDFRLLIRRRRHQPPT